MRYQYSRLQSDTHRDVAHWRGARGGLRVLSVPTCSGWLQRQANDDHYDFWPDLAIGSQLPAQASDSGKLSNLSNPGPAQADLFAPRTFIMHKNADGAWFIDAWQGELAANGAHNAPPPLTLSQNTYDRAAIESKNVSVSGAGSTQPASAAHPDERAGDGQHMDDAHRPTSFIIELRQ